MDKTDKTNRSTSFNKHTLVEKELRRLRLEIEAVSSLIFCFWFHSDPITPILPLLMYPDWPQSPADLAPLPNCEGPRLQSFDFRGPQKIKFLNHLGEGLHSHVFTVEIRERVYALKLVSAHYPIRARDSHENNTSTVPFCLR